MSMTTDTYVLTEKDLVLTPKETLDVIREMIDLVSRTSSTHIIYSWQHPITNEVRVEFVERTVPKELVDAE